MPGRLRLLWVTPCLPRRGHSAEQNYYWALLDVLARRHHVSLLAARRGDDAAASAADVPGGLADVTVLRSEPQWDTDPLALLPATVRAGLADPTVRATIAERIAREPFDVVHFHTIEMGHVMPSPTRPTVLTIHQLPSAQAWPQWQATGQRLAAVPATLFRALRDRDFERRAVRRAHRLVALTTADAARLATIAPGTPCSVCPLGVDAPAPARFALDAAPAPRAGAAPSPAGAPEMTDVLFVGHFHHPPNVDAAVFLVRDVRSHLRPGVRIRIVGHAPTDAVRALAGPDVTVTGSVPDVGDELARARVVVAPVRFGTGMRGKVLDALAAGRPVVTTSLGAEGLDAVDGRDLCIANDAVAFAAAVTRLLDDPATAAAIGQRGRALVAARYGWDAIADAHERIYEAAQHDPAPAPAAWVDEVPPLAARCARLGYLPGVLAGAALVVARSVRGPRPLTSATAS